MRQGGDNQAKLGRRGDARSKATPVLPQGGVRPYTSAVGEFGDRRGRSLADPDRGF